MKRLIKIVIEILFLLVIFITPYGYHIDLGPGPNGIFAILWDWDFSIYYGFRMFESLEYFPYFIFRIVFFYELFRFFQNKVSKTRFLLFGLITELIPLLISIPGSLILSPEGENYIPIMIPIPILLICCIILVSLWKYKKIDENRAQT